MKHPANKQERLLIEKKKREEKQRKRGQENDSLPGEEHIEG
jgi:hypothetical protein